MGEFPLIDPAVKLCERCTRRPGIKRQKRLCGSCAVQYYEFNRIRKTKGLPLFSSIAKYIALHPPGGLQQKATVGASSLPENELCVPESNLREYIEGFVIGGHVTRTICETIDRVARFDVPVLVYGETGTGKELVAQAIHQKSSRSHGRFVLVDCTALSENLIESELFGHERGSFTNALQMRKGLFEDADGGTVFLDEISELPYGMQKKLLRVLESRAVRRVGGNTYHSFDFRVIAASNRNLPLLVKEGKFRGDLLFRLNGIIITLPPLRERLEEIAPLTHFFMKQAGMLSMKFPPEVQAILHSYSWPGNIRELKYAVERARMFLDNGVFEKKALPPEVTGLCPPIEHPFVEGQISPRPLQELVQEYVDRVMKHCGGVKKEAARVLGVKRTTLHAHLQRRNKIKKHKHSF